MSLQIKSSNQVRLVSDLQKAREYYSNVLGFAVDGWGHASRDNVGFLLQQASKPEDVKPNGGPFTIVRTGQAPQQVGIRIATPITMG